MATRQKSVKTGKKPKTGSEIQVPKGKLGVMIPGMGAVATTFVAGVEAVRKGFATPIGSLTQMGTIRLGRRTESRAPKVNEFVPLAGLNDLVFTGWDIFEDDMHAAASNAGVLERELLDQVKPFLSSIKPRKAVFDRNYVKRLDGPNVKKGKTKMDLAEQVRHHRAKIAAMRDVAIVAETLHHLRESSRGSLQIPAAFARRTGKSVARNRGADHVKRIARVTAVCARIAERTDYVHELDDRTRPTMRDDEWKRVRLGRAHVQEMDVRAVDSSRELRKLVQARFVLAPVVRRGPIFRQMFRVVERDAVVPTGIG